MQSLDLKFSFDDPLCVTRVPLPHPPKPEVLPPILLPRYSKRESVPKKCATKFQLPVTTLRAPPAAQIAPYTIDHEDAEFLFAHSEENRNGVKSEASCSSHCHFINLPSVPVVTGIPEEMWKCTLRITENELRLLLNFLEDFMWENMQDTFPDETVLDEVENISLDVKAHVFAYWIWKRKKRILPEYPLGYPLIPEYAQVPKEAKSDLPFMHRAQIQRYLLKGNEVRNKNEQETPCLEIIKANLHILNSEIQQMINTLTSVREREALKKKALMLDLYFLRCARQAE